MWRVVTSTIAALTLFSTVAAAQQPCTTDANRVVSEVYRHTLERNADPGAQTWVRQLANGQLNVKEVVRRVAKSQEYMQRFGQTEAGEGQPYERAIARLYRHVLGRQPDASGQQYWARIAQQRGFAAAVDGFVDSSEYGGNFGEWGVPGSGGLRFCANQQSSGNEQSSNAPAGPLNNRRFQTMDVNNDNVVSRREWRGSAESFRSHDWNNDGVLSGNEIDTGRFRQGRDAEFEDFDRAEDFEWLDANNNNRIEEREWHASLRAFDQLDRNNDGVLSRAEFVRTGAAATTGQTIAIGGDRQWVDTGINIQAGQMVTINANGQIRVARDGGVMTAAGTASGRTDGATIPSAPVGALLARIGNTPAMLIGEARTFRSARGGRLYLGVNDNYFDDNTGQFNVTVDVD
jgi:Ca2+-binding EF-hand superfamily protein